jgi:DNA-binding NarL/FixJ family response regulator
VSTAVASSAPPGVEHPSLVPALLLADSLRPGTQPDRPRRRVRRTVRDWVVDVTLFLAAVAVGVLLLGEALSRPVPPPDQLLFFDLVAGSLGCLLLWGRRRWPVGVAVVLALIASFSDMGGVACLIALFTVAVHRSWRTVLAVAALNLVSLAFYVHWRPDPNLPTPLLAALGVVLTAAVVAWGMFVRARRQLVVSLRERAVRAEGEQRLRVAQAQQLERTRIAREMHDVLAHRLSLLSMHAGALEFRPDAPPQQVAQAAGVIRASAHAALADLREVIGVLRDSADGTLTDRPQPTLGDVPALVEESRRAGLRVRMEFRAPEFTMVPAVTGRTVYRVVQEALTNVRKHASGTVAEVRLSGRPGAGLEVEVRNPAPTGGELRGALPGAGHAPDVVLMDIRMPRLDGLTATERLRARPGGPAVIVLTTFDADAQVLRALRAGASGFLLKDTPPAAIVDAVRRVAAGEPMLSPTVTRQLIAHVAAADGADGRGERARRLLDQLTEREHEVAVAVGRGLSNADIAAELYMSVATVKAHVSPLLVKLQAANRVQVALLVHDAGLV